MNAEDRAGLQDIINALEKLRERIETTGGALQDRADNMPESFQVRINELESEADQLDDAKDYLDDAINSIKDAMGVA